jgi:WD40 repeat protein/predicted Ser/Thr protein kinase
MKSCPACQSTYPNDFTVCPRDATPLVEIGVWSEGTVIRGKYRILGELGRGGMGTVYKALHVRFNELRALKVMSPQVASDPDFVKRFEREAVVTRKLQHPNAVRVDDIDEAEDGRPFIVMEYVEGRSLKKLIQEEGPLPVARVCSITKQVAAALGAAHQLGMVHRDIKPENIVLVAQGPSSDPAAFHEQAKVLDFGIAKLKEARLGDATLTATGVVIGTPQYMSPEQALGKRGDELDGRSDLYSLGIVMYQMLSGELPFKAETTVELLRAQAFEPPMPIGQVRPDLPMPDALAALVMRCLEKKPELRPASGKALIEEMERAQRECLPAAATRVVRPAEMPPAPPGEPEVVRLRARPAEPARPRRGVWLALLTFAVVLGAFLVRGHLGLGEVLLLATLVGGISAWYFAFRKRGRTRLIGLVSIGLLLGGGWYLAWWYLVTRLRPAEIGTLRDTGTVFRVAFSPVGNTLASVSSDNTGTTVRLWDVQTGALKWTLSGRGHAARLVPLAFSPDGNTLASGSLDTTDTTVRLWDAYTGAPERTLTPSGYIGIGTVSSIAFSLDISTLASGSDDNTVSLWDAQTGALKRTLTLSGPIGGVTSMAFSPDGSTLASGSSDTSVRLWDAQTGALKRTLSGVTARWTSVAFSLDGSTLASGSDDNNVIRLWDAQTGALKRTLSGDIVGVSSVAFSPDSRTLASGGGHNNVTLWDAQTGALKRTLSGHTDKVVSVAFSPDGRILASGSYDKTIKLWWLE